MSTCNASAYADVIVFGDIVGNVLNKWHRRQILHEYQYFIASQVKQNIDVLVSVRGLATQGIVRILPADNVLRAILDEKQFDMLGAVSAEETQGNLPDALTNMLSHTQRKALSLGTGYVINYKINKALLVKERLDLEAVKKLTA